MRTYRMLITPNHSPIRSVAINAFFLGLMLAGFLQLAEQAYPIRPRWIFLEVVAGTVLTLTPVALVARRWRIMDWRLYELLVITAFVSSGLPIIIWQLWLHWPR